MSSAEKDPTLHAHPADELGDGVRHVWEFAESPKPSPLLLGTKTFCPEHKNPIHLLDQFMGRQPYLLNQKFKEQGHLTVAMRPVVLLDSQLLDAIVARMAGDRSDTPLEELLKCTLGAGWDISAIFYLLEQFAKSDAKSFSLHAPRRMRAVLSLLSMDDAEFRRSGDIRPDPEAVDHYLQASNAASLDEVAVNWIAGFQRDWSQTEVRRHLEASEIAILKMQLIHLFEAPQRSPLAKLELFESFLQQTMGLRLGCAAPGIRSTSI